MNTRRPRLRRRLIFTVGETSIEIHPHYRAIKQKALDLWYVIDAVVPDVVLGERLPWKEARSLALRMARGEKASE